MPTWLLKKCIDEILPSIVRLVNTSLRSGHFLDSFKEAVVRPIWNSIMVNLDINVSLIKFKESLKQYLLSNILIIKYTK